MLDEVAIQRITSMLYSNVGANGVTRRGCYDLPKDKFERALRRYLETGVDPLEEHDFITHQSWPLASGLVTVLTCSLPEMERLRQIADGKGFWKLEEVLSASDAEKLRSALAKKEHLYTIIQKYEFRRPDSLRYIAKKSVRQRIMQRDNFTCQRCGATKRLAIDHIIPVIKGGDDSDENLQVLCVPCNSSKRDQ